MGTDEIPKTGIIIATINRSEFLIRQLTYYADSGHRHSIYVADSSTGYHLERNCEAIQKLKSRIRIVHVELPQSNDFQATADVLPYVREPYVVWPGDDDFVIPGSLEICAQFLESHPDYDSAHGVGILFSLQSDGEYGELASLGLYPQGTVEHSSARRRLEKFFSAYYWPIPFSVQRIDTFRAATDLAGQLPDRQCRELAMSCLLIIRGKAKQLDLFQLVRQHHRGRYLPDPFDWVTNADWHSSNQILRDHLSRELACQDDIALDEAREVVKAAFWSYLGHYLNYKWQLHYGRPSTGSSHRIRRVVQTVPGLQQALHALRPFLSGEKNKLSLSALLHRSSPYHADFMPIYRAITIAPDSARWLTGSVPPAEKNRLAS